MGEALGPFGLRQRAVQGGEGPVLHACPCRCARWDLPSSRAVLFVYDICMREDDVTREHIQQWADEAEAGYDVEELKRRGRGRPGRGAEPMQVVAVRLTVDELAALDAVAGRENVSRSEAIRRALAHFAA